MHHDDIKKEGIVPVIENLKEMLNEVGTDLSPLLDEELSNESADSIRSKISAMDTKMQRLIESINHSYELIQMVIQSIHTSRSELKKSVDGLIKKTGMQLQKVTSTTEEATNKILDVAEKLDEDQMKIIDAIDSLEQETDSGEKRSEKFEDLRQKIYQNQESAFTIMDYLQFQDITAQQIAGAYALLSDTEKTLLYVSETLKRLDTTFDLNEDMGNNIDKNSFNADASYADKASIQSAIDNLFESGDENVVIPDDQQVTSSRGLGVSKESDASKEQVSNDDIDALFGGGTSEASSQDDIDALFGGSGSGGTSSQDDIDALFSNTSEADSKSEGNGKAKSPEKKDDKKSEAASQEEIDKLFG